VVEDEENTRIVFGDILRHLAYEPILARSAEAARAAIESAAPDIILLDVRLPLMSGYEFLRLRAIRESKIPIVAVSGAATESDARSCLHFVLRRGTRPDPATISIRHPGKFVQSLMATRDSTGGGIRDFTGGISRRCYGRILCGMF